MTTATSPTLAIDHAVRSRRAAGADPVHLGFGEVGLPALPELEDALAAAAGRNGYGPVAGVARAREAAADWFTRRGRPTVPDQVVFGPGSKPLLFAVLMAVPGDVVLPQPSWVSYAAQAGIAGRTPIWAPIGPDAGGVPDPGKLDEVLRKAVARGLQPGSMVLTVPDNPTGTVAGREQLRAACAVAERWGLVVVCDEIYAELVFDPSVSEPLPLPDDRVVTTSGLSKSLGLGGWRVGFARLPDTPWGRRTLAEVTGLASEVWSSPPAPMQEAAAYALTDPPEVTHRVGDSRRLHGRVVATLHRRLADAGVECRAPQAGFYLYPSLAAHRRRLAARSVHGSSDLATALLDGAGVATLPGTAFGDDDEALTLRLATSLLYGADDEQRLAALSADEPERLPWIAAVLERVASGFGDVCG